MRVKKELFSGDVFFADNGTAYSSILKIVKKELKLNTKLYPVYIKYSKVTKNMCLYYGCFALVRTSEDSFSISPECPERNFKTPIEKLCAYMSILQGTIFGDSFILLNPGSIGFWKDLPFIQISDTYASLMIELQGIANYSNVLRELREGVADFDFSDLVSASLDIPKKYYEPVAKCIYELNPYLLRSARTLESSLKRYEEYAPELISLLQSQWNCAVG